MKLSEGKYRWISAEAESAFDALSSAMEHALQGYLAGVPTRPMTADEARRLQDDVRRLQEPYQREMAKLIANFQQPAIITADGLKALDAAGG